MEQSPGIEASRSHRGLVETSIEAGIEAGIEADIEADIEAVHRGCIEASRH